MAKSADIDKDKKIKNEIARLKKLYANVDELKKKTLEGLIEECAYMRISLKELRGFVDRLGFVDEMEQGAYTILRESPYYKAYISMLQRYTTASEKLLALLPKDTVIEEPDDGFNTFVSDRDD
jgi:hypothetical protein